MHRLRDRTLLLALLCMGLLCGRASAVTQLVRTMDAPPFVLKDQAGTEYSSSKLSGQILILVFGETYHDKTRLACQEISEALRDQRLRGQSIAWILISSRQNRPGDAHDLVKAEMPPVVLLDTEHAVFESYQVTAMPSIVIVDREGKVVHAIAGMIPRLSDYVLDSLLLAAGRLSSEQFQRSLEGRAPAGPSEQQLRIERLALLARQLQRRSMDDMALEKYAEVLRLDPDHAASHLEIGKLLLRRSQLADAESHFRAVLARDPKSLEASLGIAQVQTARGGDELGEAERLVRDLLTRATSDARAWYLLGLIQEQRGKSEDAAASFKKSAQLLLRKTDEE